MQSFILDRHTDPSNPVMKVTQDDKIPIYDSKADAEADIANIEEGAIVATKDTGASEKVVDVVQDGNMNPVTSNAVYDFAFDKSKIRVGVVQGGSADNDDWVATFDTPFPDSSYYVIVTPRSSAAIVPNGWYTVSFLSTGFSIFCKGNAPTNGFAYIAIHI